MMFYNTDLENVVTILTVQIYQYFNLKSTFTLWLWVSYLYIITIFKLVQVHMIGNVYPMAVGLDSSFSALTFVIPSKSKKLKAKTLVSSSWYADCV